MTEDKREQDCSGRRGSLMDLQDYILPHWRRETGCLIDVNHVNGGLQFDFYQYTLDALPICRIFMPDHLIPGRHEDPTAFWQRMDEIYEEWKRGRETAAVGGQA